MTIETQDELDGMVRAGRVVRAALDEMTKAVGVGVSTQELDDVCAGVFHAHGAQSAPQLAYGFPGVACVSINEEAVHGIPRATRTIQTGDLVKLDVAVELDGYVADAAVTVAVHGAPSVRRRLARCAQTALRDAISVARAGTPLNAIGRAVQTEVERREFSVMPRLGGHGVGRSIHEDPFVRNNYLPWDNQPLHDGLVIAIEPVISAGSRRSVDTSDGWTVETADGAPSAHFEHTIVVTRGRPLVLTE